MIVRLINKGSRERTKGLRRQKCSCATAEGTVKLVTVTEKADVLWPVWCQWGTRGFACGDGAAAAHTQPERDGAAEGKQEVV